MLINFAKWQHKIETYKRKEPLILVINMIVSLISCSAYFLFFYLIQKKAIYQTDLFDNFLTVFLIFILYFYLSIQTNIYLRKKFNLINSPTDLLKQFFPIISSSIISFSFLLFITIYFFLDGSYDKYNFKDIIEIFLYLSVPNLIFYTIYLITYKLKQIFNNIFFEKVIFVTLNTLLSFFTLQITATIITIFDLSKISIIFIVPILFIGLFSFQFKLLNKTLYIFDIKKINSNKDIIIFTLISSIIYLISIANEIMLTVLKADFENASLIAFLFLFIYSLVMCVKTKILKPLIFIILFIYIVISVWNF